MQDYVQPHDKLLIPHELMEIELITKGMNQTAAHNKTCLQYNYPKESDIFYRKLQQEKHARIGKGDIISGGITHKQRDDWDLCL